MWYHDVDNLEDDDTIPLQAAEANASGLDPEAVHYRHECEFHRDVSPIDNRYPAARQLSVTGGRTGNEKRL